MLAHGTKVSIAFVGPSAEQERALPGNWQYEPEQGEVVSFHMERDERFPGFGPSYLVKVTTLGTDDGAVIGGRKRLRVIPEKDLTVV